MNSVTIRAMMNRRIRRSLPYTALLLAMICVSGCLSTGRLPKALRSGAREAEDITTASFLSNNQISIRELAVSTKVLANPTLLEDLTLAKTLQPEHRRDLLLAEAFLNKGRRLNESKNSLDDFLRAAHFAYQGILSENCSTSEDLLCADLRSIYSSAVSEVLKATEYTRAISAVENSRYILDTLGDGDPISSAEWEISRAEPSPHEAPGSTLGTPAVGCRSTVGSSDSDTAGVTFCSPLSFLIIFDGRTDSERTRAHLIGYDTFESDELRLHDRSVVLPRDLVAASRALLQGKLSDQNSTVCLGEPDQRLPSVLLLLTSTAAPGEWARIVGSLAEEPGLVSHFNFCLHVVPASIGPSSYLELWHALMQLFPDTRAPIQVVLVSEGSEARSYVAALQAGAKDSRQQGARAPRIGPGLSVAGSLHVPPITPPGEHQTTTQLKRHAISPRGLSALNDIKRLLSRLSDTDDGVFGHLTRQQPSNGDDIPLSPVM